MKALFRGFCRNDNGKEELVFYKSKGVVNPKTVMEVVKGDWVYWDEYGEIQPIYKIGNLGLANVQMVKQWLIPETVSKAVRGLRDKNGQQVFEGDLVRDDSGIEFIIYDDEDDLSWRGVSLNGNSISLYDIENQDIEVIGTKWDK